MQFRSIHPPAPLSSLVESIWDCRHSTPAHRFERMLPSACAQLVFNLAQDETRVYDEALRCTRNAGAALDAPAFRGFIIDTAEQTAAVGVVFRAGAAAAFFRERMDPVANRQVDLDALARDGGALRQRLLEARDADARLRIVLGWLSMRMDATGARMHPAVAHALQLLDDPSGAVPRIPALAAECRLAPRRFGELFREQVGMGPKRYARLQRFHRVVAQVHRRRAPDWAGLAVDCGFHDQAHLAHEFRAFAGMAPSAYLAQHGDWMRHAPLA